MYNSVTEYQKQKEFLICVDSDGCAMDTMDCKHIHCFGPCMVDEWELGEWKDAILKRWNDINLYTITRGINRFKGLAMALVEINEQYTKIEGIEDLVEWAENSPELSERNLKANLEKEHKIALEKALKWSQAVNIAITKLPEEEKVPFAGALEGLRAAHAVADVAIVSSANREAVLEEWEEHKLLEHVDIVLTQEVGSKAECIRQLLLKGYKPENVLMVGDAKGDSDAAATNGVNYYPILVKREKESWDRFQEEAVKCFTENNYEEYGKKMHDEFLRNLGV
ncbi:MAG: HAD hydrolase-like protein [Cellulosilyticum sp.]|nr:HAD hydrolase-like protein [Cellulosilyticum sp.]